MDARKMRWNHSNIIKIRSKSRNQAAFKTTTTFPYNSLWLNSFSIK